jgi:hypothetical protein
MMGVADLLRLGLSSLTSQQIADVALEEDRARREAERRGDTATAALHDEEVKRLADLLPR